MTVFAEYLKDVAKLLNENPNWRFGQACFNELHRTDPEMADVIRGTWLDPFFNDAIVPPFLNWVESCWSERTSKRT